MTWEPILDGELAEQAREAVRAIAAQIAAPSLRDRPHHAALFLAYAASELDDDGAAHRAALQAVLTRVECHDDGISLYGGLAGAAWTLAHVTDDSAPLLEQIDEIVVNSLWCRRWLGSYDLIDGLVGLGVYLLEREPSALTRDGLAFVVAHIEALAEHTRDGATWHTPPEQLSPWQRETCPDGYYNCGMAHGVPAVAALLGRIAARADAPAVAGVLCADSIRWLRVSMGEHPRGRFPSWIVPNMPRRPARSAWCYGDPGIAAGLWSAAARIGAPTTDWRELAIECANRPASDSGVIDAGVCHGAMGLAHIFNRCYQATGESAFRLASRSWFVRGLAMRRPGEGIGGFVTATMEADGAETTWVASHDLLDGAAGIGLALLAGFQSEAPDWDRLLLIDLP